MKGLISLAVVVAFFVAIPQCLGQSQDAEKDASQLLEEQQLVQMFHLAMVQRGRPQPKTTVCHQGGGRNKQGNGFRLTVKDGNELIRHCEHGDCTNFETFGEGNSRCVCPEVTECVPDSQ